MHAPSQIHNHICFDSMWSLLHSAIFAHFDVGGTQLYLDRTVGTNVTGNLQAD